MYKYIYIYLIAHFQKKKDLGKILAFFLVLPARSFSIQKLMQYHRNYRKLKGSVVSVVKEDDFIAVSDT